MSNDCLRRNRYHLRFNDKQNQILDYNKFIKKYVPIMNKEQTLNHFHTLTDQELEQVAGGGWLEKLLSSYLNKYKLGQSSQTNL